MQTPRAVRKLLLWLDQVTCWHVNEVSHREDGVWSLRCLDCGRVSNGVDTKARYVGPKEAA